jgi:hypothetical protein
MGWFLIATAVLVLIPVVLQYRAGEQSLRDLLGFLLFAAGLFIVGLSQIVSEGDARTWGSYGGLAVVVLGLLLGRPGRRRPAPPP